MVYRWHQGFHRVACGIVAIALSGIAYADPATLPEVPPEPATVEPAPESAPAEPAPSSASAPAEPAPESAPAEPAPSSASAPAEPAPSSESAPAEPAPALEPAPASAPAPSREPASASDSALDDRGLAVITPDMESVTVWLTDQRPDDRAHAKTERSTGDTLHLWSVDLRYPPDSAPVASEAALDALADVLVHAKERWFEFEVEIEIAKQIEDALAAIPAISSVRDRDDIVRALLIEGAAVARVFNPATFATDERAAPYRVVVGGRAIPKAWRDAYAISGRLAERADLVDGTAWYHYSEIASLLQNERKATLEIPAGIGTIYVDGREAAPGTLTLASGRHWLHVLRDDVLAGHYALDVAPSAVLAFPAAVSSEDLAVARQQVIEGHPNKLPQSVSDAIAKLQAYYGRPVFLAALDGHKVALVGGGAGAKLTENKLVTVLLAADIGGGVVGALPGTSKQPIFAEAAQADDPTAAMIAAAPSVSLSAEIGISYFIVALGVDGYATPGRTIAWGDKAGDNHYASSFVEPWGGIGAYLVRPTKRTATVAIYGTAGWMSPAFAMYGGRIAIGIPIDQRGNWFRFVLGGSYAPDTVWNPSNPADYAIPTNGTQPAFTGFLRIGFGSRL